MFLSTLFLAPLIHFIASTLLLWVILQYGFKKKLKASSLLTLMGLLIIGGLLGQFFTMPGYYWTGYLVYLILIGIALYKKFNLTKKQVLLLLLVEIIIIGSVVASSSYLLERSYNQLKSELKATSINMPTSEKATNEEKFISLETPNKLKENMSNAEIVDDAQKNGISLDAEGAKGLFEQARLDAWRYPEKDADNDGINNFDEFTRYKTDPLNADTDGDGYSDKEEISSGHDPLKKGETND